ncbi:hypothetical protein HGRIS_006931 [Hohenbuehelia grisea]|uniref:Cytochrome P450 n=1 Tax=Hohenbuehelia grisea TaxID=104357 RepID=A0ABR3JAT4_9AGAR
MTLWAAFVALVLLCFWRLRRASLDKRLPGPRSPSWLTGHLMEINGPNGLEFIRQATERFGSVIRVGGLFGEHQLMVSDPSAFRHILLKSQHEFREATLFTQLNTVCFGEHALTVVHDEQHKVQRKAMNPLFISTRIRNHTPVVYAVFEQLLNQMSDQIARGHTEIDIMDAFWRLSISVIGRSVLGEPLDALDESKTNVYVNSVKNFFPTLTKLGGLIVVFPSLLKIKPRRLQDAISSLIPSKAVKDSREIIDVIRQSGQEILSHRRASLEKSLDKESDDIVSFLLRAEQSVAPSNANIDEVIVAQINLFVFAGSDTTSASMARMFHLLALNPDIQATLRVELSTIPTMPPSSDDLARLTFVDAIVKETLRMFPPLPKIERVATRDTAIPLKKPVVGTDGSLIHEIMLPKDHTVILNLVGCNTDVDIWGPDALEWKPERWLKPLPDSVQRASIPGLYANTMTFLGGNRACIGYSLAILQMKLALAVLIPRFTFELTDDKVTWPLGTTQSPTTAGREGPHLPLRVSRI